MLGVCMWIKNISKYVNKLKITENSFVFVVDDLGNLISEHAMSENLYQDDELVKISSLKGPWAKSFTIYHQTHQSSFIYSVDNNKYIAAYKKIAGTK